MYLIQYSGTWSHVVTTVDSYKDVRRIRYHAKKMGIVVTATRHW